jgi:hypothetical protein
MLSSIYARTVMKYTETKPNRSSKSIPQIFNFECDVRPTNVSLDNMNVQVIIAHVQVPGILRFM